MQLNFQSFGSGTPLIILHGLFGSSDNWQSLAKRLGQHFTVYAVDQRNHGESPHSPAFNYAVMADDLRDFLDARKIESAYILGHSMGGKTAMQFALSFPDRVQKLVVVDIAPKHYRATHDKIFEALLETNPGRYQTRGAVDAVLAAKIPDTATRQFLLKNLTSAGDGFLKWKIDVEAIHKNYPTLLDAPPANGTFTKPTLFIRGERSDYIQPSDQDAIQSRFPNPQMVSIPKADHWVHADAPNEFLQAVLSFLQQ